MDDPVVWTVSSTEIGGVVRLDVELSEGVKSRPNLDWFFYHAAYREDITRPYLRIETTKQPIVLPLSGKTLSLTNPRAKTFYALGPEKPEWPLRRSFFLESFDHGHAVVSCGYEACRSPVPNNHMAAGPTESVYDCRTDAIVYVGPAVAVGTATIDVASPSDKQVCSLIPESVHDYEKAFSFAKRNHYFLDGESCRFSFVVYHRMGNAAAELHIEYRLLCAFCAELEPWRRIDLPSDSETMAFDLERNETETISFGDMSPGVYHLDFRLMCGADILPICRYCGP